MSDIDHGDGNHSDDDTAVYRHPALDVAIAAIRADGFDAHDTANAMISAGLSHLRSNLCDEHVIENLEWVKRWIDERIAELKTGKAN